MCIVYSGVEECFNGVKCLIDARDNCLEWVNVVITVLELTGSLFKGYSDCLDCLYCNMSSVVKMSVVISVLEVTGRLLSGVSVLLMLVTRHDICSEQVSVGISVLDAIGCCMIDARSRSV